MNVDKLQEALQKKPCKRPPDFDRIGFYFVCDHPITVLNTFFPLQLKQDADEEDSEDSGGKKKKKIASAKIKAKKSKKVTTPLLLHEMKRVFTCSPLLAGAVNA